MKTAITTTDDERAQAREIAKTFQKYVETYPMDMVVHADGFIDDMLYGLGIAFRGEEEYGFHTGFEKWKDELRKHLGCHKTVFGAWVRQKPTED